MNNKAGVDDKVGGGMGESGGNGDVGTGGLGGEEMGKVTVGTSNEELLKQIVELQKQVVEQQQVGLDNVSERRVNKYAVLLLVAAGYFLLWFFGNIIMLAYGSSYSYAHSELLVHDHIIMPLMAVFLIIAAVQLLTKKYTARMWVGVAMGTATLWNIVATIHGFVVDTMRDSWSVMDRGSFAVTLGIVRFMIGMLFVVGMTLWFYKSKSIQGAVDSWWR